MFIFPHSGGRLCFLNKRGLMSSVSGPLSDLEIHVFFTLNPEGMAAVCDHRGKAEPA